MTAEALRAAMGARTLLADGSTGTQLMARGLRAGECAELWNVDRPDAVRDIAATYFAAGSDAVLTNTFQGSSVQLAAHDLAARAYELNRAGAELALAARPAGKWVFASIGPTGQFLAPLGPLAEEDAVRSFGEQVRAVRDAGVDACVLETFTDLKELECAIRAVREHSDLPFVCSLTYEQKPRGYFTMMGVSVTQAADALGDTGALAVGSNCGNGFARMCEIAAAYRAYAPDLALWVKPNAGLPEQRGSEVVYTETPADFAAQAAALLALRPAFVGGCCGTTAEHVAALRAAIDAQP